jgi:ribonuclease Y
MDFSTVITLSVSFLTFLTLGSGLGLFAYRWTQSALRKSAQAEAQEILEDIQNEVELRNIEEKERTQEIETEAWLKDEPTLMKLEEHIEELDEDLKEKISKWDSKLQLLKNKFKEEESLVLQDEKRVQSLEKSFLDKKSNLKELRKNYIASLLGKSGLDLKEIKEDLNKELILDSQRRASLMAQNMEEEAKDSAEANAKKLLSLALDRFARPYSSERGIAPVYFPDPHVRSIVFDAKGDNIKAIQDLTGCDIILEDDMDLIGVAGYDPVRRELTRRLLEKLIKEKKPVKADYILRCGDQLKKDLFRQIKQDGDQLAKELKLENLHPEIRQMMGSLRFRYSFTQNQYFHCGEVGWLCGLLAAELGLPTSKGRRAGMLHDLGKSMDHELDGGHAVIGANFIEKRNEAPDIVHAVRAHHYDEQPSTDLAFLVIAADAISGARPGARRSTMESYTQKVTELEAIAKSFEGVTDCYILSGGRECRVLVNSKKIDDHRALRLSAEIAKRIENECNYPGQIKVVVVRETLVSEYTKQGS